jgi:imidazolonepropionase-like amidohydrolase
VAHDEAGTAGDAAVKNATVWTSGPQGILANADVLIKAGKYSAIGKNLAAPKGAVVVDAAGKHMAPASSTSTATRPCWATSTSARTR